MLTTYDTASPRLHALAMAIRSPADRQRFLLRWGARIRKLAQQAALAKGGRRLWREIARSVVVRDISADGVTVAAMHRVAAQKQFGGPIRAKGKAAGGADFLAIPIPGTPAVGQSPAKFALAGRRLFVLGGRGGATAATAGKAVLGYEEDDRFQPLFVLKRETRPQRPDKFWPEPETVSEIGAAEAAAVLAG